MSYLLHASCTPWCSRARTTGEMRSWIREPIQLSALPRAPPGVVGAALGIGERPNIFLSAYPVNWELQRATITFASREKDPEGRRRHAEDVRVCGKTASRRWFAAAGSRRPLSIDVPLGPEAMCSQGLRSHEQSPSSRHPALRSMSNPPHLRHALNIDFSCRIGHSALVLNPSTLAKL